MCMCVSYKSKDYQSASITGWQGIKGMTWNGVGLRRLEGGIT